jgi:hypothetical protein
MGVLTLVPPKIRGYFLVPPKIMGVLTLVPSLHSGGTKVSTPMILGLRGVLRSTPLILGGTYYYPPRFWGY